MSPSSLLLASTRRATRLVVPAVARGLRTSPYVFLDSQASNAGSSAPVNHSFAYENQMDSFATGEEFHHESRESASFREVASLQNTFKRVPLGAYPVSVPYEQDFHGAEESKN